MTAPVPSGTGTVSAPGTISSLLWFSPKQAPLGVQKRLSWDKQAAPCAGLQAEEPQGFRDRDGAKGCWVQLLAQAGLGLFPLPQEKEMWPHTA